MNWLQALPYFFIGILFFLLGCYILKPMTQGDFYRHTKNMIEGKEPYDPKIDYEGRIKKELGLK